MLNEPLPIMDKQRVLEIEEKPRLKYIKNEEDYLLHNHTAHQKFMRGNQNTNRNFSLMNFTIENTQTLAANSKVPGQANLKGGASASPTKQGKKTGKFTKQQTGGRQIVNLQQQNIQQQQAEGMDRIVSASNQQNQWNGDDLQWGEQDYSRDHDCILEQQTNRCKICSSVMKYFYHTAEVTLQKPYSIYYVDYIKTFSRKMDCHTLPKSKQKEFLIINYLPYMREWAYFILDRLKHYGLEEFVYDQVMNTSLTQSEFYSARAVNQEGTPLRQRSKQQIKSPHHQHSLSHQNQWQIQASKKLPFSLQQQFPQIKPFNKGNKSITPIRTQSMHSSQIQSTSEQLEQQPCSIVDGDFLSGKDNITLDFETFTVLGNYESSNINFCTVDKKESKCQVILRSDTNTKGCLHWFMFSIKINKLFKQKKNKVENENKRKTHQIKKPEHDYRIQINQEESKNGQDLDQSFDKKWIVIDDEDDEEEEDDDDDEQNQENQQKTITFSILNNKRNGYLFREGMQIAVFDSTKQDKGWHRGGDNIYYYRSNVDHQFFQANGDGKNQTRTSFCTNVNGNTAVINQNTLSGNGSANNTTNGNFGGQGISQSSTQPNINQQLQSTLIQPQIQPNSKRGFQTMDFSYTFTENNQRVTFAYCYPYTYTDLIQYLEMQEQKLICSFLEYQNLDQDKKQLVIRTNKVLYKKKTITSTRIGLPILLLKITSSKNPKLTKTRKKKKIIFIIARQHPGETPSSYACEGFISYLLADTIQAKYLLENYIFKIVPMMNPDGVVIGNSRCNLAGSDLNRKWDNPDPILHPEVYEVKKEIKKSHLKREVAIFCDLHGHSMKKHAFFYGCNKTSDGGASSWTQVRLIPRILSKKCHLFSIKDCKFRVTDDKKNTARVICWNELKISNSFTLETSFFGYDDIQNDNKPTHFTISDLINLGKLLCESIVEYTLVMDILTAELIESKGWLKPYRLVQVTGESAQNKIIKNMKEQKKLEKQKRIEANISNIQQEKEKQLSFMQSQIKTKEKRSLTPQLLVAPSKKGGNSILSPGGKNEMGNGETKEDNSSLDLLQLLCPDMKKDWRDYFGKEELEKNFKKIDRGEDPNDQESASGSDSEAEIDIFKESELLLSNEAKNRKKQKKKKQPVKKEKESNINTIDGKGVNEAEVDINKKKKPSTAYPQSSERNRWNPSPLIQNYKQQLEMKKQQLKKQSYPIAKVGQSFSSAYQVPPQIQENTNFINLQQSMNSQASPQQIQRIQYQPQQFGHQVSSSLAKNSVNGAYLEKKLIEMQQVQQSQQGFNTSNVGQVSRNSQAMIYSNTTQYKQRKSMITSQEDNKININVKGIQSSNSEANQGFRLNTSDMQTRLNENQYVPNSSSSAGNYGKYSTSNSTHSSNIAQQTQYSTRKGFQNMSYSQQQESLLQEAEVISDASPMNNLKYAQLSQAHKQSRANSQHASQNKLRNSKNFIVDDDDDIEEQAMSKYKNSLILNEPNAPIQVTPKSNHFHNKSYGFVPEFEEERGDVLSNSQVKMQNGSRMINKIGEVEYIDVQIMNQKNNVINFNSAGISNYQMKNKSNQELMKRAANTEAKSNNNLLSIPHNFISSTISKNQVQPFLVVEEQLPSNNQSFNNMERYGNSSNNNNLSSSNSDTVNNMEEFAQLLNNVDQTSLVKEIAKNASNFDRKIRAQAPIRQLMNPDKQNAFQALNGLQMLNNVNPLLMTNNNFIRNSERAGAISFNNSNALNSSLNNIGIYDNKSMSKKYRARSIQESKAQVQNSQYISYNNQTFSQQNDKNNTTTDEQKLQIYLQENGQNFIPFKNFSAYSSHNQSQQTNNNIRIRKLNFI